MGLLGGSNETWPTEIDGRQYLSMWGSSKAPGGCCHYESKLYTRDVTREGQGVADVGGWGKTFRLDVMELPEVQDSSDDPLEIVEEEDAELGRGGGYGADSGGEGAEMQEEDDKIKKMSVRSSNVEKKNNLRNELSNQDQEELHNQDAEAKEREEDFSGLDQLFT